LVDLLRRHLFLSFYNDSPLFYTFFLISPAWCYFVAHLVGIERLMPGYERGDGSIRSPGEEDPTETTDALPVGSRTNRANVTCHCAEEV